MRILRLNGAALLLALAVSALAADNKGSFQAKPAADYPHKQTSEKVTIAASVYLTDDQTKEAFGKLNPWRLGVLPVLVVIQNDGKDAIRIDRVKFVYTLPDNTHIEATPAADVKYVQGPKQPGTITSPIGVIVKKPKSPLAAWEIEGRAFSAKMIPAGQSASGFVYFQTPATSDAAVIDVSGLINAATNSELYYFEIPLPDK